MLFPNLRWRSVQYVDHAAHVIDEQKLDPRNDDRKHSSDRKDLPKRPRIVEHKGPELARRRVGFVIRSIRIDKIFEVFEHWGDPATE